MKEGTVLIRLLISGSLVDTQESFVCMLKSVEDFHVAQSVQFVSKPLGVVAV